MERKRIEKLVVLLLIGILLPVSLFPFRINADTITNSNVNINYYLDSVTEVSSGSYMQTYKVEFVFDKSYLGWISSKMVGTYISNNTVPTTTSQFTKTQAIYVNGNVAATSFTFITPNNMNGGALQSLSQSIQNSNVTPLADLSTLDDILNILVDINNNIEIDVIQELQNIVSNTSLANTYLETISKLRQFDFPIESFPVIYYNYRFNNTKYVDIFNYYLWSYPVFNLTTGDTLYNFVAYPTETYKVVLITLNLAVTNSDINNLFEFNGLTYSNYQTLFTGYQFRIFSFDLKSSSQNQYSITLKGNIRNIIPVYIGNGKNLSTDFALNFGMTNDFLDNIQIIANGTQQSSSAAASLDQTTSQFSDDSNNLVTIEESFNNSMNSALQNVSPSFNMGQSFLNSANWVSQQFNRLVNNTPFASLITFGLTLGLGLLIIGKVRK